MQYASGEYVEILKQNGLVISMSSSLPMRGAIGPGYLYFEEDSERDGFGDSSFLLGDALVDAAKHEKEQNWLGARLTPRVVKAVTGFVSNDDQKMILDCKKVEGICEFGEIPLKNGNFEKGYYLLPYSYDSNWRAYLPSYFRDESKLEHIAKLWMWSRRERSSI